jgi:protein gp37
VQTTKIEYADSSVNLQMGCDGCELWNPRAGVRICYAGQLTERYAGQKGSPASFEQPALFPERLAAVLRWRDLTGSSRSEKPWLDDLPRVVFLDDMGDSFTESLPIDWLAPHLPALAASPHVYLLLTKRPGRMAEFSRAHPLPANVWPGASVTAPANAGRLEALAAVRGGGVRWASLEPLLGAVDLTPWLDPTRPLLGWVVVGGESGSGADTLPLSRVRPVLELCRRAAVPCFVKQVGTRPVWDTEEDTPAVRTQDYKGGDPAEWPAWLRVRQMPRQATGEGRRG